MLKKARKLCENDKKNFNDSRQECCQEDKKHKNKMQENLRYYGE